MSGGRLLHWGRSIARKGQLEMAIQPYREGRFAQPAHMADAHLTRLTSIWKNDPVPDWRLPHYRSAPGIAEQLG